MDMLYPTLALESRLYDQDEVQAYPAWIPDMAVNPADASEDISLYNLDIPNNSGVFENYHHGGVYQSEVGASQPQVADASLPEFSCTPGLELDLFQHILSESQAQ